MKLEKVSAFRCLCIALLMVILNSYSSNLIGQYQWDWRDPLNLNIIDFGDNKLVLYNGIGVGLSLYLATGEDVQSLSPSSKISGYVEYLREYDRPPISDLVIIKARISDQLRKFLSWGGDLAVYRVRDDAVSAIGIGIHLNVQWIILQGNDWKFIYDNGVGPNLFSKSFPEGGTKFNFTTYYGFSNCQKNEK